MSQSARAPSVRASDPPNEPPKKAAAPIAFIDIEASGLGPKSWPVEIGWAFVAGPAEAMLVRPSPGWDDAAWNPAAEALHGLTRDQLRAEGVDAATVCRRLNEVLSGARVYSDAPDFDGAWLYRLFAAAGLSPRFRLRHIVDLLPALEVAAVGDLFERAAETAPVTHRAGPDSLHLQAVYRLAREAGLDR